MAPISCRIAVRLLWSILLLSDVVHGRLSSDREDFLRQVYGTAYIATAKEAPTPTQLRTTALQLQQTLQGLNEAMKQYDHNEEWHQNVSQVLHTAWMESNGLLKELSDEDCYMFPSHRSGKNPAAEEEPESMFGWTPMKCWTSLWHPYLWLYIMHLLVALATTILAFHRPKVLMVVMVASGFLWPLSALINLIWGGRTGWIWDTEPWSGEWVMTFIKWLIVDAAAALPVLIVKEHDVPESTVQTVGMFIYGILGANILWTLLYKVNGWVRCLNFCVGIMLTLSLALEVAALINARKPLLEKINGIPYGRATPLLWLVCYTGWNATFVGDLSIGMTLQDCLFWAMMYMMQFVDPKPLTIDLYFAFARPLQLGVYIALGCWSGIFPWFREAERYYPVEPLGINNDFYFLFLTAVNLVVSFVVVGMSLRDFLKGPQTRVPQRTMTMAERDIQMYVQELAPESFRARNGSMDARECEDLELENKAETSAAETA